jgi:hypothetical protein
MDTVLVYDFNLKAPACVLLQAAMGGDSNSKAFNNFDSRHWLVAPTPGMRKVSGTDEQWKMAAEITAKKWGENRANSTSN